MRMMKSILFILLVSVVSNGVSGQKMDKNLSSAFDSIQPMNPYIYCKTLSSTQFAGRLTGHEGYTAAANWAAGYFKKWGLKPIDPKTGYLQPYPSPYVIVDKGEMILYIDGKGTPLELEKDFLPLLFSGSGNNKAPLVFVGWGIHAPELGYDDYEGLDVKGKFVLCFRGTPDHENPKFNEHDQHRHRMKIAKERGSLGLIYIYNEIASNPNGDYIEGFTPAEISFKVGDKILKEKGITSDQLQKELQATRKPKSFIINNSEIEIRVQSRDFPNGIGYNIAGYIEGSDPELKKECLIIGGHFDHNGAHMGLIFPGADDNASGSAVIMEIAHAFSLIKNAPKRSVLFVLFGGEEKGLMGSYYFAEHLPAPFTKVDAMYNFDMEGEGAKTVCGISKEPPQLEQTMKAADVFVHTFGGLQYLKEVGVRSSDFAPFYLKGAPCIAFYSNGPHVDYHRSGDSIYRINPDMLADVARLAFLTAYNWADR